MKGKLFVQNGKGWRFMFAGPIRVASRIGRLTGLPYYVETRVQGVLDATH